ncbi:acyl-CoA reductase [Flexithrix dorotheae]|uniref:acyl-CoA reductase n=1 Tax=Flexithrix dorotheae TaxID=70993 RepID=UPI00035EEB75|nr:acyl-CoA reductase [Flexithrix dorotheae]
MNIEERLKAFEELRKKIKNIDANTKQEICQKAHTFNNWFVPENVALSFKGLETLLAPEKFRNWAKSYQFSASFTPKKVGVIMAGNIPMVGIHDFISVLVSGHILYAKLSSQDPYLLKVIAEMLIEIEPRFADKIVFAEQLKGIDALIATGSNNSARYFEYYFKDKPKIIRKNRVSCAVLNGKENEEAIKLLGTDVLTYYGLGCRNVSKVFLPNDFDLTRIMSAMEDLGKEMLQNHKYANNYDYNKSIYLIKQIPHLDNGGLMLKESEESASPIAVLFYEFYKSTEELSKRLENEKDQLQCIVADGGWYADSVPFGKAQYPEIDDYADGVDTLSFLLKL